MNIITLEKFSVVGITVRTSNENAQAVTDIPALWHQWISEDMLHKIPNRISNAVYCIYTRYEKDHTRPYTALLGCPVAKLDNIPLGMEGISLETENYVKYSVKGNLQEGVVFEAWTQIWKANLNRKFSHDFEVYDEKAHNPEQAKVDIFVAVHAS